MNERVLTLAFKVGNITTLEEALAMEKAISAADANRKFSQLLRDVKEGRSYVVTSHGRPVARIAPVQTTTERSTAASARASLLGRLRREPVVKIGRWKRDELYD
jgi:prevent-host-death family protein